MMANGGTSLETTEHAPNRAPADTDSFQNAGVEPNPRIVFDDDRLETCPHL